MVKKNDFFEWPVWGTREAAAFISRALKRYKRPISPGTVRRWAKGGKIPAQRQKNGAKGSWLFDPDDIREWVSGRCAGKGKFQLAYSPRAALQQVRDLLWDVCDPEHTSEWVFEANQQETLCTAIRTILNSPHYASIWAEVRHLAKTYRGNPALNCLEGIGELFN